jgi:formylmethanofuran dehydrogenase subunit E
MRYTDNPVADFYRYDAELADEEELLPHCDYCGEPIYECYYDIDGDIVCKDCLDDNFKKWVDE